MIHIIYITQKMKGSKIFSLYEKKIILLLFEILEFAPDTGPEISIYLRYLCQNCMRIKTHIVFMLNIYFLRNRTIWKPHVWRPQRIVRIIVFVLIYISGHNHIFKRTENKAILSASFWWLCLLIIWNCFQFLLTDSCHCFDSDLIQIHSTLTNNSDRVIYIVDDDDFDQLNSHKNPFYHETLFVK